MFWKFYLADTKYFDEYLSVSTQNYCYMYILNEVSKHNCGRILKNVADYCKAFIFVMQGKWLKCKKIGNMVLTSPFTDHKFSAFPDTFAYAFQKLFLS